MTTSRRAHERRAPVLELKGLSKSFGGLHAVRDVNLQLFPGDRKAIIGPNGAGKTTLFNVITGVLPADLRAGAAVRPGHHGLGEPPAHGAGHGAHVSGHEPVSEADGARQRAAGDHGPAHDQVRDVAPLSSYRDVYEKAHGLLENAGSWDRKDVEVRNLSHGEQRQIEIVLGLASDPEILLLDEPAAGLSSGESQRWRGF